MTKVLFLHGFYASGSCPLALALKEKLQDIAQVLTPDLPKRPAEALAYIRKECSTEHPDLLIGNSCGAFYAQIISNELGTPALLGNPHFEMTAFLQPRIGSHEYKSTRQNGNQKLVIDEDLVEEFRQVEQHQFDNIRKAMTDMIWGIFGEQDKIAHYEPLFLTYYKHSYHFPGGHTPTPQEAEAYHVPIIKKMLEQFSLDSKN